MIETGTLLQERFLIEEQIGRGGMGAVYIAVDNKFGSRVAIKERSYEDPELARAFEREARLLNSLHHPILPHVSDYFSEEGRYFLVMEYIDGEDLSTVLAREGAFPVENVVRWTLELLDGLDYLHSQDPPVIHRDIKPGNLKLTPRGNIVLLDFGLAKESENNTLAGRSVFGYSRRYSPLEQIEGTGTDARSDIFSLGATAFHLITGEPPTDALARASAIVAGRPDPLRPASEISEQVPSSVAAVINSALALNADQRFVSANAMRAALEHAVRRNLPAHEETPVKVAAFSQPVQSAVPEVFPALEAFQADEHSFRPEPSVADSIDAPSTSAARREQEPATAVPLAPQNRVRVRFIQPLWQRPAVWAAAIFALLLFSYVIYRSGSSGNTYNAPAEQSTPAQSQTEQTVEVSDSDTPDETDPASEQPALTGLNKTIAESKENPTRNRVKTERPKQAFETEQAKAADEPAMPVIPAPQPRSVSTQQSARRPVLRPAFERERVVRPAFERQQPVYSIETIITGVPPAGQEREGRRQRRQLTMWEQDQLRRQRFEDMIRSTRRWQLPF